MNIRNFLVNLGDLNYYQVLDLELKDMSSVLDVGCGSNSPLAKLKRKFNSTGVDIYKPSIERSRKLKIHDNYKVGDVLKIENIFANNKFDAVIALDLIEHLEKKDGFELIRQMIKLARKKVIIMTPNGFYKQEASEGNQYQIHRSGWEAGDFSNLGFKLKGLRGVKWLRGEYATIRLKPWFFWGLMSTLSQGVMYFLPKYAYQLLAVKTL